jgi:septum formation protein
MDYELVLASQSPRRAQLLESLGFTFSIRVPLINEDYPAHLVGPDIVEYLSLKKAKALLKHITPAELIIASDTIVVIENEVLGKPENEIQAKEMLFKLSNKTHQVYTGLCLLNAKEDSKILSSKTDIQFKELSEEEIDYYIQNFKPFDKAGSYGIQEWIGMVGIKSISGNYFSVMGLPVFELYQEIKNFNKNYHEIN